MSRLRNGQVVHERYQVLSFLGQGSFAQVYLTNDQKWRGNLVALKEIPTAHFSEKEYAVFNAQFLQEAAFLMRLSHPGLPRVVEFFAEKQNYYLALEWVPGHTLEQEINQRGNAVGETEVLDWGLQLAEVLRYLHSQKPYPVLLGDLKPANVVVDYQGKLRVIDFGVARYAAPQQDREYALVSPGFSPPEQYRSGRLDERCDLYSLGATLWWCLNPVALERFRFEIPSIRATRSELTPALDALLQKCLQPERSHRFHSAEQVINQLRGVQQAASVRQVQTSPSEILSALYKDQKKRFDF
ncbi:serine/threonine protein kinase [bacterium]|nr:serine/threonine protein kinase [bacterium]